MGDAGTLSAGEQSKMHAGLHLLDPGFSGEKQRGRIEGAMEWRALGWMRQEEEVALPKGPGGNPGRTHQGNSWGPLPASTSGTTAET